MTLILELPDNKEMVLKARAQAQGVSAEQFAEQVLNHALDESANLAPTTVRRLHISEKIRERMSKIPSEVWGELPPDGASEHDHYIYGLPKKDA